MLFKQQLEFVVVVVMVLVVVVLCFFFICIFMYFNYIFMIPYNVFVMAVSRAYIQL